MSTVPTLIINSTDQTDFIQSKTLYWRLKSLDFTLIDPVTMPALHDPVALDVPEWHGRVSTVESHPFKSANGTSHHYVLVTCTNKLTPGTVDAPFGISDAPNHTTTYPYKDLVYTQTLADQTDLATAEHRLTATVYQPGLLPGQTLQVTCAIEGLSTTDFIITEMQTTWLRSNAAEYHIGASVEGVPPVTLGGLIGDSNCDCAPFVDCVEPDVMVRSVANSEVLSCVFPLHAFGQDCASTDYMILYKNAVYRLDYLVFHGNVGSGGSNGLTATLGIYGGNYLGSGSTTGTVGAADNPAIAMGGINGACNTPNTDIPIATHPGYSVAGTDGDTFAVTSALIESPCNAGDSYSSSVSVHITWLSGPDPRFSDLGPCEKFPFAGQPIAPETRTGDGSNSTFNLTWPYMPGSIQVIVEGVDWTDQVIEDDPTAGDFSLAYPPPDATDGEPNVEIYYRYPKPAPAH